MILGQVEDFFPRLTLALPGRDGPLEVEFLVDTGFYGELALPISLLRLLDAAPLDRRTLRLVDGSPRVARAAEALIDWNGEPRLAEVLELGGEPLLGVLLLQEYHLHAEMTDGGEVLLEPL